MKISFCLITLNEEANLSRCLESLAGLADEIVILDSGSTDGTRQIAARFGARWQHQPWLGYVGQKNLVLSLATHPWVFSIDADEALSTELRTELQQLKALEPPNHVAGYSMPRCVPYEGRWIRHGDWYPDRLIRLFRRNCARFAGGKVHERLEVTGDILALRGDIHHHSFKDAADHWARCQKYARLWAESRLEEGRVAHFWDPSLRAAFKWLRGYVIRGGFLDGSQGWRIARINAREVFLKYQILRELQSRQSAGEKRG